MKEHKLIISKQRRHILRMNVEYNGLSNSDVITIGDNLLRMGFDSLCNGGFWVWDMISNEEYYSPLFEENLGVENLPQVAESWMKYITEEGLEEALTNLKKSVESGENLYTQIVEYNRADGTSFKVICTGDFIYQDGKPVKMVGLHELI